MEAKETSEPVGKEKVHYEALEQLYQFCLDDTVRADLLYTGLRTTMNDWDTMMGGGTDLQALAEPYLKAIMSMDKQAARKLYLFLSPIFFFIRGLHEVSRKAWRNAVTIFGIFCERTVRNLLQEIDRRFSTRIFEEMEHSDFERKNGRLKSELEGRSFRFADDLYGSLKRIYFVRNITGPHDVPPPEPIQAKICTNECLPAYIDYLNALVFLGNDSGHGYEPFITLFSNMTQTSPALVFGEEFEEVSCVDFVRDILYREGFFADGKTLNDVMQEMGKRRYNFTRSLAANTLRRLSRGRQAILTRRKVMRIYRYFERIPPVKYFRTTL